MHPVSSVPNRHTFHTYFNVSPESPDGQFVLFFASRDVTGEVGDLVIQDRRTGEERILATGLQTEDAHRGVCQQWVFGGRYVAYHEHIGPRWRVMAVTVQTGEKRLLAADAQLGFGTLFANPNVPWVPIYGCHWNPGSLRDFVLVHVETGERRTVCTLEAITAALPSEWCRRTFGPEGPQSIFFPVLSHDGTRAFFKLSRGIGGEDWKSWGVSVREGKVVCDVAKGVILDFFEAWGHPSWHPSGRGILEKGNVIQWIGSKGLGILPPIPTDHPSFSPDGSLFVSDGKEDKETFEETGIRVVTIAESKPLGRSWQVFRGVDTRGATSWRRSHLHPVFSPDGKRVYFNVNDQEWTRLCVADVPHEALNSNGNRE